MKPVTLSRAMCIALCCSLSMPWTAFADESATSHIDIELLQGGTLVGQIVDTSGQAAAQATVSLVYHGKEIATTTSDENGLFAVRGLRGGEYLIEHNDSSALVRAWSPGTAPPSAIQTACISTDGKIVRANNCDGCCDSCNNCNNGCYRTRALQALGLAAIIGGAAWAINEAGDNS